MKLELSNGKWDLCVKHDYNQVTKQPMATAVSLTDDDGTQYTGVSYPKHGDSFVYNEGRKFALKSLLRKMEHEEGFAFSKTDKQILWMKVCPKFYDSSRRKTVRKHLKQQRNKENLTHIADLLNSNKSVFSERSTVNTTFNFVLLILLILLFYLFI